MRSLRLVCKSSSEQSETCLSVDGVHGKRGFFESDWLANLDDIGCKTCV